MPFYLLINIYMSIYLSISLPLSCRGEYGEHIPISEVLANNPNLNTQNEDGETALMLAAKVNDGPHAFAGN